MVAAALAGAVKEVAGMAAATVQAGLVSAVAEAKAVAA